MNATCFSKRRGRETSSESIRARYRPRAYPNASFSAIVRPVLGRLKRRMRGSAASYFLRISVELSVDPSSMMMNSKSLKLCARMLSTAWARYRWALYTGIATETNGLVMSPFTAMLWCPIFGLRHPRPASLLSEAPKDFRTQLRKQELTLGFEQPGIFDGGNEKGLEGPSVRYRPFDPARLELRQSGIHRHD